MPPGLLYDRCSLSPLQKLDHLSQYKSTKYPPATKSQKHKTKLLPNALQMIEFRHTHTYVYTYIHTYYNVCSLLKLYKHTSELITWPFSSSSLSGIISLSFHVTSAYTIVYISTCISITEARTMHAC